jgi:hypothetical protein
MMQMPAENDTTSALNTTLPQDVKGHTHDCARTRPISSRISCLQLIALVDHGGRGLITVAQNAPKASSKAWSEHVRLNEKTTPKNLAIQILRELGDTHCSPRESSVSLGERIIRLSNGQMRTLYISNFFAFFDEKDEARNYRLMQWLMQLARSGEFLVVLL